MILLKRCGGWLTLGDDELAGVLLVPRGPRFRGDDNVTYSFFWKLRRTVISSSILSIFSWESVRIKEWEVGFWGQIE